METSVSTLGPYSSPNTPTKPRVHFLGEQEDSSCLLVKAPDAGRASRAAAGGASGSGSGEHVAAQAARLRQQRMPGFVCNLYYEYKASPGRRALHWIPSRELPVNARADVSVGWTVSWWRAAMSVCMSVSREHRMVCCMTHRTSGWGLAAWGR